MKKEFNKVYNIDFLDGMKSIKDDFIDLLLTDPPYGINLTPQRNSSQFKNTKVKNDDNLDWLDEFVNESYRIMKNAGFIFCSWQKYDIFKQSFEKKFIIKNLIVWDKMWFGMGNNFRPNHEFIMFICKTNIITKSNNLSNILSFRRIHPSKMIHSCEKPVSLLELLINETTNEEDIVLDPFAGSGSCLEASLKTKRRFIGFDNGINEKTNEHWSDIANQRCLNIKKENVNEL